MLFSSFQTDTKLKIRQALLLSSGIKQDVLIDFRNILKEQSLKSKLLIAQGKKNEKELRYFQDSLDKVFFVRYFVHFLFI